MLTKYMTVMTDDHTKYGDDVCLFACLLACLFIYNDIVHVVQ